LHAAKPFLQPTEPAKSSRTISLLAASHTYINFAPSIQPRDNFWLKGAFISLERCVADVHGARLFTKIFNSCLAAEAQTLFLVRVCFVGFAYRKREKSVPDTLEKPPKVLFWVSAWRNKKTNMSNAFFTILSALQYYYSNKKHSGLKKIE
jgi:hypothetical protein